MYLELLGTLYKLFNLILLISKLYWVLYKLIPNLYSNLVN